MKTKVRTYEGNTATVTWDQKRCIHAGACVRGLPEVFNPDQTPWIEPNEASDTRTLTDVIMRCPSGALHLEVDGETINPVPDANTVSVEADGPLYVRGDIVVQTPDETVLLQDTRVALCRCGLSKNKPLCDNSHVDAFEDDGSFNDASPLSGKANEDETRLTIIAAQDGPLLMRGPFTLTSADDVSESGSKTALCRCGSSHNKPFCDGTHRKIGFTSA